MRWISWDPSQCFPVSVDKNENFLSVSQLGNLGQSVEVDQTLNIVDGAQHTCDTG